jgi:electron transfer flavoprotein alpha subunit
VAEGRLFEPYLTLSDADCSALETALRLREQATAPVTIQVVAVGHRGYAPVLREALSLGVDRVRLLLADRETPTLDSAADALAVALGDDLAFDLLLGGSSEAGGEEGLLARLTAEALGVPYAGKAVQLAVRKTEAEGTVLLVDKDGRQQRVRPLAAAVMVEAGQPLRPFSVAGYLHGLAKAVEVVPWPKRVPMRTVAYREGTQAAVGEAIEEIPHALSPIEAACQTLGRIGLGGRAAPLKTFDGTIEDVSSPSSLKTEVVAVLAADSEGRLQPTAAPTVRAASVLASTETARASILLVVPASEEIQRRAIGQVLELSSSNIVLLAADAPEAAPEIKSRLLRECWSMLAVEPRVVVGEPWTEEAFASLSRRQPTSGMAALRVRRLALEEGYLVLESRRARGQLRLLQKVSDEVEATCWITLTAEADVSGEPRSAVVEPRVERWSPRLEGFYGGEEMRRLLDELKQETGLVRLTDADFIIDVGFGVGNRDGYEAVIEPLERALRELGVRGLVIGGSRKVTEELHLLPADRQIGQSGVTVNPQVLLAIGISGAPQHLNYIGPRATILAFNRDPDAPLMTLNQRQPRPRVFPIIGDLFETVPAFIAALRQEQISPTEVEQPAAVATVSAF